MLKLENYEAIINKCSHCGYCQATCPVYLEDMLESHVARNRLNLINQVLILKTMPSTPRFREILDRCLLCTNCTQTCSSKVPVDEIIIAARAETGKSTLGGLKSFVMSKMLQQRGLTGLMGKAGSLVQKMGVAAREIPQLASKPFSQIYSGTIPAQGEQRGRVAYFVGCGTNFLYPDTGIATVQVLTRNGWEVEIPAGQVCCGIPAMAEGDLAAAREMVATNLNLFDLDNVDAVITDCTSCGMMIKEYTKGFFRECYGAIDPASPGSLSFRSRQWYSQYHDYRLGNDGVHMEKAHFNGDGKIIPSYLWSNGSF
jgi:glycolate oxidase iron-sulfur subunit